MISKRMTKNNHWLKKNREFDFLIFQKKKTIINKIDRNDLQNNIHAIQRNISRVYEDNQNELFFS